MNVNQWYLVLHLTVLIGSIYVDGLSTATNERGMYFNFNSIDDNDDDDDDDDDRRF